MKKVNQVAEFGKKLMILNDMEEIIELIGQEAKDICKADRCSIFIVDKEDNMLWTRLSDGIGRIVISIDSGIVGDTYQKRIPQMVNNPYEDSRFLPNIDKKSGYVTRNILTVPIFDSKRDVIGVMQLLNKHRQDFNEEDLEILTFFSNYISGSVELVLMNDKNKK